MNRTTDAILRTFALFAVAIVALIAADPAAAATVPTTQSISVTRGGGFAGRTEHFVVDQNSDDQRAQQALNLAAQPQFRRLAPEYLPENTCCDRFTYRVVAVYNSGVSKTVVTMDGVENTPPVLFEVIDAVVSADASATVE
ncbi:protealysin inhibitor emfourin [Actinoplanes sp. NPDC049681]|uniref:protealysin inhibitor emfourin n=1 Tax=Actinoplanes sp. NPDC049681 TaxID=3363905 RepID=UPI0037A45013